MRVTIYVEQQFAVLEDSDYKLTVNVSDNKIFQVSYDSKETTWLRKYLSLEELLQDNQLQEIWKWLCRGMTGIPIELIKK